jgi:hypothetical protein
MATLFKNNLISGLGTTETTILTTAGNARTTVVGLSLANLTGSIILASIRISDPIAGTAAYYMKDVIIPPNQSLRAVNGGERLILGASTSLLLKANTDSSLDVVMSYIEII